MQLLLDHAAVVDVKAVHLAVAAAGSRPTRVLKLLLHALDRLPPRQAQMLASLRRLYHGTTPGAADAEAGLQLALLSAAAGHCGEASVFDDGGARNARLRSALLGACPCATCTTPEETRGGWLSQGRMP